MKPTETLTHEHDLIKRGIRLLTRADARLQAGDESTALVYLNLVDFIRHFADEYHHAKEEDILFKALEERGVPRENSPLAIMFEEHEEGRSFVRNLEGACRKFIAGDKTVQDEILQNSAGFAQLLNDHIYKEDEVLYPMADKILSDTDQQKLHDEFERVEKELGQDQYHHYEQLIAELEQQAA